MLEPNSRQLLLESLQPPVDFRLDWALGTTYTLDLMALLTAPVAFAFSDWQDRDGRPVADPLALLKAVRQYADRICLFCQAGKIHVPGAYLPLLANLEQSIVEASAPRGGSFHPKVWFLRFVSRATGSEAVFYRLLCLSRNMTFDRSWDTLLSLEGRLTDRIKAFSRNHPLGQFVEALPAMSARSLSTTWRKRISDLAEEIRRVDFEVPAPFDEAEFKPIGIAASDGWLFPKSTDHLLIVSPFVDEKQLAEFAKWNARTSLISRPDMLSQLNPYVLRSFDKIWVLDDAADPEPAEAEEQAESRDGASGKDERVQDTEVLPLLGLHAKLYVSEHGWLASLLTGSANATTAAFDRNVEFMVELTGKKSRCGIEAILGRPDSSKRGGLACLRDLLVEYTSSGVKTRIDETVRAFEQQVDRLSRQMASQTPIAKVAATESPDTFSVTLQPTKKCQLDDLQGCRVRARPLSHSADQLHDVQYTHEQWVRFESVSLLGLTSFYVLVVESADQKLTRQFVLNVPLEDAPAHRQDFILRNMLGDSDRVLRFLLLLLMDTGARDIGTVFGEAKLGTDHSTFIQSLFGTTLFESLVRSLARDPERIDHVAEVIDDLRMTSEGRRLLPANLDAIWNPVWTIRQKQIADLGTKRKGAR